MTAQGKEEEEEEEVAAAAVGGWEEGKVLVSPFLPLEERERGGKAVFPTPSKPTPVNHMTALLAGGGGGGRRRGRG